MTKHEQVVQFLLNKQYILTAKLDIKQTCQKSTLLKGLFDNYNSDNDNNNALQLTNSDGNYEVKLQLERPEKFNILLYYLETGNMTEEFDNITILLTYINDILYLGMEQLEIHAQNLLEQNLNLSSEMDFSKSRPKFDFIERFLREKIKKVQVGKKRKNKDLSFDLLSFLMRWIHLEYKDCEMDKKQISRLIDGYVNLEELELQQIQNLCDQFPEEFNLIIPSTFLTKFWMPKFATCSKCQQTYPKLLPNRKCHHCFANIDLYQP